MQFRWLGASSFAAVATLALALAGCGGGGTVTTGASNSDGREMTLSDKWQRFADGAPTLRMTEEEVSEAWRAAAGKSTHRVILAGPVGVGNDPGSLITVGTWPAFPAEAETCSPGDCDFDPPPDSAWAFAPALEHNSVPLAEFKSRFTETRTLEAQERADDRQTTLVDSLTFGGWLEYTHFNVSLTRWCTVGSPGCVNTNDTDDFDLLYAGGGVLGYMAGRYAGTTPSGARSATWTGVMVGMEDLTSTALQRERPDVLLGEARIVIDDLAAPDVDVSFTDIHNVIEGTRRRDMSWEDLPLKDGLFGRVSRESDGERRGHIIGMFTGPGHQEVGGEFRDYGIAGAFGAKRRP